MTCHGAAPKDGRDSEKGLLLGPRLLSKVPNVFHDNEKMAIDHVRMQHSSPWALESALTNYWSVGRTSGLVPGSISTCRLITSDKEKKQVELQAPFKESSAWVREEKKRADE